MQWMNNSKNTTSYSMGSGDINNSSTARTNVHGDDIHVVGSNTTTNNNNDEEPNGFIDEPARHRRTWEEKEKEESFVLEEDLYSLMYLCRAASITMAVSVMVFMLQIFILGLILADLTRDAPTYPQVVFFPLQVPIDIPSQVVVAQFVSLIVATINEEDVFISLKALIIVGHDERVSVRFPGATPLKWWLANIFRFVTGLGTVIVSFFFIVGADNVLDIFSNFAAMEFISYIDNMVYKLARWGYIGKVLQRMTIKVESVSMENRREKGRWWALLVVIFLSLTVIPLVTFWTKVRIAQKSGFYLEQAISTTLTINFGDERLNYPKSVKFNFEGTTRDLSSFDQANPPELMYAYFSGNYEALFNDKGGLVRYNDRPMYFERNATECVTDPACGAFYYCGGDVGAWVYSIRSLGDIRKELDQCEWGWVARSDPTEAYGLEELDGSHWKIWTGVMTQAPVRIESDQCALDSDCSLNGACNDGTCECFEGWQGNKCNIPHPFCPALAFSDYGVSSRDFKLIGPFVQAKNDDGSAILVYQRPVYYRKYDVANTTCSTGVMYAIYLYTGRQWHFTLWCEETLARYVDKDGVFRMEENLHTYWDNILGLDVRWASERTSSYFGTGLHMLEVRDSYSTGSMSTFGLYSESRGTFECIDIPCTNDKSVCGRKGSCEPYEFQNPIDLKNSTYHKCVCRDYYGGPFCQFSPTSYYARDHFAEFQRNASASLAMSPYEYQSLYWEPLLDSGVDVDNIDESGTTSESEQESTGSGSSNQSDASAATDDSNIFSNQSGTTEGGEL